MKSESSQKESKKKANRKWYKKNKEVENQKARERMRRLRSQRATESSIKQAESSNASALKPMKKDPDSERSPTPDHLRWPTPEYLRDYAWEAQMEELKRKNEERKEKREVKALLLSDYDSDDYDSDDSMDGLGYVPDSEGYLLLAPEAPDSDCPNRR